MANKNETHWQWMHNVYGGMGWFTHTDKIAYTNHPEFTDGYWRLIPPEEVEEFYRAIEQLAYEQS